MIAQHVTHSMLGGPFCFRGNPVYLITSNQERLINNYICLKRIQEVSYTALTLQNALAPTSRKMCIIAKMTPLQLFLATLMGVLALTSLSCEAQSAYFVKEINNCNCYCIAQIVCKT